MSLQRELIARPRVTKDPERDDVRTEETRAFRPHHEIGSTIPIQVDGGRLEPRLQRLILVVFGTLLHLLIVLQQPENQGRNLGWPGDPLLCSKVCLLGSLRA